MEDSISNKIIDIFLELLNNFKIEKFSFVQEVKNNSLDDYLLKNKSKLESVFEDSIIDLSLSEKKIINGFSKGHKSSIKKLYPELNYEIIAFLIFYYPLTIASILATIEGSSSVDIS